jgi:pseudouridine kinase
VNIISFSLQFRLHFKEEILLTARELEIIAIIKRNPLVSQQEIADELRITRSSVAVHITNLIRKGIIKGKGYVIEEKEYVSVVGGANVDISGVPFKGLIGKDSNPGVVHTSLGGVGRNIAENLVRLGVNTKLFSIVGDDLAGERLLTESAMVGIDISHVRRLNNHGTGTYLSILDEHKDMTVAISYMDIFHQLKPEYLKLNRKIIEKGLLTVFDTNLDEEVLRYGVSALKGHMKFLDTVSVTKALRARDIIGEFHTVKPNKLEAESLTGVRIENRDDMERSAAWFLEKGVRNVFISLGKDGVYYSDGTAQGVIRAKAAKVVNATGAGDAFHSGLVYAELMGFGIREKTVFSIGASLVSMASTDTISKEMSVEMINQAMEENYEEL